MAGQFVEVQADEGKGERLIINIDLITFVERDTRRIQLSPAGYFRLTTASFDRVIVAVMERAADLGGLR